MRIADLPTIYLCRHGQTDWNAARRLQGQSDIPLNDHGRSQARRNGRRLRELLGETAAGFRYLSSPMDRACETMRLVRTEMGLAPDAFDRDDRLREIHFGDWQGFSIPELRARDAAEVDRREREKWTFVPPGEGAESYAGLADRIAPVFEALTGPTIVTAHGGVVRTFLARFAEVDTFQTVHADIPQDLVLRIENGRTDWL